MGYFYHDLHDSNYIWICFLALGRCKSFFSKLGKALKNCIAADEIMHVVMRLKMD